MSRVLIIGGGIIGCSIGLELVRRGVEASVVDGNGDVGHGSTSASCGIVRRFYSTRVMTAMAHEGAEIWAHWSDHLGVDDAAGLARFERPGMLFVLPLIDDGVRSVVAHMGELGIPVELLGPEQVAQRFPFLDTSSHTPIRDPDDPAFFDATGRSIGGAVFEPDAGYVVSPQMATADLRQAGEREGVKFHLGRSVSAVEPKDGGFSVTLEDGAVLLTDVVVNAAGPHSALINEMAGVSLGLETRALRREVHALENPVSSPSSGSVLPVIGDVDSGVYLRPEAGGQQLVVGSLDPPCDDKEWVADLDQWDESCRAEAFERQSLRAMKRLPELRSGPCRGVTGLYDVTLLDWNPIIDRTDLDGFFVAMGTSGSSFKTAPVIGRAVTELIQAQWSGHDHDADPISLRLERIGTHIDLGFFSRNRRARPSSGTVLA